LIEAHDHEVICLAYSPLVAEDEGRYWLASGSRDKNILVFDSKNDYQAVGVLE
jgi:protein associated with RNAse G/E